MSDYLKLFSGAIMSHEPTRWYAGLLPLGLIYVVGTFVAMGRIEPDLRERTLQAIGDQKVDALKVETAGRDVALSGAAFSPQSQNEALATTLDQTGVRLADITGLGLIPEAKPYVWRAERADNRLSLSGGASNPVERATINDAAGALGGLKVTDAMQYARGAGAGEIAGATVGLHELALFSSGAATLTDGVLSVSGEAASGPAYDQAMEALNTLPQGVKRGATDILPPLAKPFAFSVNWDPQTVILSGVAPTAAARDALRAAAAADFPGARIENAVTIARGAPDGDFNAAAAVALGTLSRLSVGSATLIDGALAVKGAAPDGAAYDAALQALKTLPAGATLASADIIPPLAKPFAFTAAAADGTVRLSGVVASVADRDAVAAQAARDFPAARIENALTIARGAPDGDFAGAAKVALGALAGLASGEATLSDGSLSLTGKAAALGQIEAVGALMGQLPAGFALGSEHIDPPLARPYQLAIAKAADGVTLTGMVPNLAARQRLEAAASAVAGGARVTDLTQIAAGLPEGLDFDAATSFALSQLALLKSGEARFDDASLALQGAAPDEKVAAQVDAALAAPPPGLAKGDVAISRPAPAAPAPAATEPANVTSLDSIAEAAGALAAQGPRLGVPDCDAGLKAALNGATIEFASGKADVSPKSYALVVKLAGVALRCDVQHLEISGHTDSQGDAALNQKLSEERAGAIVKLLAKAGVASDKMSAVGYGATKPVASNDTDEGRAANRRIEFSVQ